MIKATLNAYYAYKFLRLLTMSWSDTPAFKAGVIDKDGNKILKNAMTPSQADAYSLFDRLVYNIKRLVTKIPGSGSKFFQLSAALWLIKESFMTNDEYAPLIREAIEKQIGPLNESVQANAKIVYGINVETNEIVHIRGKYEMIGEATRPGIFGEVINLISYQDQVFAVRLH